MSQKNAKRIRQQEKENKFDEVNPTLVFKGTDKELKLLELVFSIEIEVIKAILNLIDYEETKKTNYQEIINKLKFYLVKRLKENTEIKQKKIIDKVN